MNRSLSRLSTVCRLLNAEGVRYVIVGGFAAALHGLARATQDVDVLIEPTVENADRAIRALSQLPFGVAHDLVAEDLPFPPDAAARADVEEHERIVAENAHLVDEKGSHQGGVVDGEWLHFGISLLPNRTCSNGNIRPLLWLGRSLRGRQKQTANIGEELEVLRCLW